MITYDIAAALATTADRLAETADDRRDDMRRHYLMHAAALVSILDTDPAAADPMTDAIIGRAISAPWFAVGHEYRDGGQFARYTITPEPDTWTTAREPSPELHAFLTTARLDVLRLAAEVRRLRRMLTLHADDPDDWACLRCGAAYFGEIPETGLCRDCRPLV